mmetsp:Transcript_5413/g.20393  ORF Transcript_5413/g.20393 Transcript_5413/m.20393 type:complete len:227 (-) Transcript_5413:6642-7322(-)
MEFTATLRVYVTLDSHHARGCWKFSRKKWCITGLKFFVTDSYAAFCCSLVAQLAMRSRQSRWRQSVGRYRSCAPFVGFTERLSTDPPPSRYSDSNVVLSTHSNTPAAGVKGTTLYVPTFKPRVRVAGSSIRSRLTSRNSCCITASCRKSSFPAFASCLYATPSEPKAFTNFGWFIPPTKRQVSSKFTKEGNDPVAYRIVGSTGTFAVTIGTKSRSRSARFLHAVGI